MKKVLILVSAVMFMFCISIFAQQNPLDGFLAKYSGKEGVKFLELKTNMVGSEKSENEQYSNKVIDLKMISIKGSGPKGNEAKNLYNEFFQEFNKDNYIGLVEVKSSGDNVEILVKKENNRISEFIIAVKEEVETTLIAASGNFDLKDLAKISEFQNCKGLQVLEKLCEE